MGYGGAHGDGDGVSAGVTVLGATGTAAVAVTEGGITEMAAVVDVAAEEGLGSMAMVVARKFFMFFNFAARFFFLFFCYFFVPFLFFVVWDG